MMRNRQNFKCLLKTQKADDIEPSFPMATGLPAIVTALALLMPVLRFFMPAPHFLMAEKSLPTSMPLKSAHGK